MQFLERPKTHAIRNHDPQLCSPSYLFKELAISYCNFTLESWTSFIARNPTAINEFEPSFFYYLSEFFLSQLILHDPPFLKEHNFRMRELLRGIIDQHFKNIGINEVNIFLEILIDCGNPPCILMRVRNYMDLNLLFRLTKAFKIIV